MAQELTPKQKLKARRAVEDRKRRENEAKITDEQKAAKAKDTLAKVREIFGDDYGKEGEE